VCSCLPKGKKETVKKKALVQGKKKKKSMPRVSQKNFVVSPTKKLAGCFPPEKGACERGEGKSGENLLKGKSTFAA